MRLTSKQNWIAELPKDARQAIEKRLEYRDYGPGELIHQAGAPCVGMCRVHSGHVKLLAEQPDGERALLAIYARGHCFGDTAMIARRPYLYTAMSTRNARVGFLSSTDFDELITLYPSIPETLCRKTAIALSSVLSNREMRNQAGVAQSVALVIYNLAMISETPQLGSYREIDVPVTISELSSFLGLTRQTVQKEISSLKKRNLISKLHGTWAVRDMEQLGILAQIREIETI